MLHVFIRRIKKKGKKKKKIVKKEEKRDNIQFIYKRIFFLIE